MGVTEANWRDGISKDPLFGGSETPRFVGRIVAALAQDPNVHRQNGHSVASWNLAKEYEVDDVDGSRPHWGSYYKKMRAE
jgi:hypothetical protein